MTEPNHNAIGSIYDTGCVCNCHSPQPNQEGKEKCIGADGNHRCSYLHCNYCGKCPSQERDQINYLDSRTDEERKKDDEVKSETTSTDSVQDVEMRIHFCKESPCPVKDEEYFHVLHNNYNINYAVETPPESRGDWRKRFREKFVRTSYPFLGRQHDNFKEIDVPTEIFEMELIERIENFIQNELTLARTEGIEEGKKETWREILESLELGDVKTIYSQTKETKNNE